MWNLDWVCTESLYKYGVWIWGKEERRCHDMGGDVLSDGLMTWVSCV